MKTPENVILTGFLMQGFLYFSIKYYIFGINHGEIVGEFQKNNQSKKLFS